MCDFLGIIGSVAVTPFLYSTDSPSELNLLMPLTPFGFIYIYVYATFLFETVNKGTTLPLFFQKDFRTTRNQTYNEVVKS